MVAHKNYFVSELKHGVAFEWIAYVDTFNVSFVCNWTAKVWSVYFQQIVLYVRMPMVGGDIMLLPSSPTICAPFLVQPPRAARFNNENSDQNSDQSSETSCYTWGVGFHGALGHGDMGCSSKPRKVGALATMFRCQNNDEIIWYTICIWYTEYYNILCNWKQNSKISIICYFVLIKYVVYVSILFK